MGYKINLRGAGDYTNILKDLYVELDNTNWTADNLHGFLDEISGDLDNKESRRVVKTLLDLTAEPFDMVLVDTTAAVTITLPASATHGDQIYVSDVTGSANDQNITIDRNGHNISGAANDILIDVAMGSVSLIYDNATNGWHVDAGGSYFGSDNSSIDDPFLTLNADFTAGTPTENGGLIVSRGDEEDTVIRWNETTDVWELTTDGTTFETILSGTGSGVDHGNLQGLGDDDHSQYVHNTIDRTITANHTFDPTVQGAPFEIGANADKQLVEGLNAQYMNSIFPSSLTPEPSAMSAGDLWFYEVPGFDQITMFWTAESAINTFGRDIPSQGEWYTSAGAVFDDTAPAAGTYNLKSTGTLGSAYAALNNTKGLLPLTAGRIGVYGRAASVDVRSPNISYVNLSSSVSTSNVIITQNVDGHFTATYKANNVSTVITSTVTRDWSEFSFAELSWDSVNNVLKLYVNGVLEVTKDDVDLAPLEEATTSVRVGSVVIARPWEVHTDTFIMSKDPEMNLYELRNRTTAPHYDDVGDDDYSDITVFHTAEEQTGDWTKETFTNDAGVWGGSNTNVKWIPAAAKVGTNGIEVTRYITDGGYASMGGAGSAPPNNGRVGFWFRVNDYGNNPTTQQLDICWCIMGGANQTRMSVRQDRVGLFWRDSTQYSETYGAVALPTATWMFLEMVWHQPSNLFDFKRDGNIIFSWTGAPLQPQVSTSEYIRVGVTSVASGWDVNFDNIMVSNDYTRDLYALRDLTQTPKL